MEKYYKQHIKIKDSSSQSESPQSIIARGLLKKFNKTKRPVIIAVGGPGGTGKSSFAKKLAQKLKDASVLTLDDYKTARKERAQKKIYGAHPDANHIAMLSDHLKKLRKGAAIEKPVYCRKKGEINTNEEFSPLKFVIAEGEISTYKDFYNLVDFSIFIDSHWKTQLNTRIQRDIEKRGYTPQKAIAAFLYSNLHEFAEFGAQSRNWADVHIYCGKNYKLVIDAVCAKSASFMIADVSAKLAEII